MKVWPGNPYPLGATWDGSGVNFALFSENATGVELCLFDGENRDPRDEANPDDRTDQSSVAYLFTRSAARTALWLSCAWTLQSCRRSSV